MTVYELVRRDLLHRERQDNATLGVDRNVWDGPEAILDAYDAAIDLTCALRQMIENITVGDVPGYAR